MYSEQLLDHFRNPRFAGVLEDATARARVMNPVCGDILELTARVEAGRIAELRFLAKGCTACIACGSALAENVQGIDAARLRSLKAADVEAWVGGLIPESKHAARLAEDALRALQENIATK
jgi:nitrogen fixation protein NifU and related proteins